MSRVPSASTLGGGTSGAGQTTGNDLRDVDLDSFLDLLIAEMQNQDPLDPLDNSELLQQVSQIREIGATNKLTETLDAVLTGQNLSTASGLIGKQVRALTDENENVSGVVDKVSVEGSGDQRTLRVHIGAEKVKLENVREVTESA